MHKSDKTTTTKETKKQPESKMCLKHSDVLREK